MMGLSDSTTHLTSRHGLPPSALRAAVALQLVTSQRGNTVTTTAIQVGDIVTVDRNITAAAPGGYGTRHTLYQGESARVTRVYSGTAIVRYQDRWSIQVDKSYLIVVTAADGTQVTQPRKLGEPPEGEEGVDYILPTDPRLKWLWDDAAKYAQRQSWCSTYDEICARLGIPGRPRDFGVSRVINGITLAATIRATTQKEADEMFAAILNPQTATEEPVAATVG